MSDNYEFMRASVPQEIDDYSPYVDKQANQYINDINNGVYTNNSLSLVTFDLGQIYNSQKFSDTNDAFAVFPITMVAAFSTGTALVTNAAPGAYSLLTMKTNFLNLIHQADLQINGKTIEPTQPYINIARHFQLLSEMSVNDLKTMGHSLGFSDTLDNYRSMVWYDASGNGSSGNGLTNNRPFIATAGTGGGVDQQIAVQAKQNNGCVNGAIQYKIARCVDISTNAYNNIVGKVVSATHLQNEFRPYYTVSGNYMIWYDYAVIKLSHIFESLSKIGLVRRFDATLRLWINTGTVNVNATNGGAANQYYYLSPSNNTFSNTCPFMINYTGVDALNGVPVCTNIVAGLYIAKPPVTSFAGINLANSGASHPLQNCRVYYSQIEIHPKIY